MAHRKSSDLGCLYPHTFHIRTEYPFRLRSERIYKRDQRTFFKQLIHILSPTVVKTKVVLLLQQVDRKEALSTPVTTTILF